MPSESLKVSIGNILARLEEQAETYKIIPEDEKREFEHRALTCAYVTAHTESREAARRLANGDLMRGTRTAIERRSKVTPDKWDEKNKLRWHRHTAKARFARALSGFSLGADAVCLDTHMLALPKARQPKSAVEQWSSWFVVYSERYGEDRAEWCIDWHRRLLDYIAGVPSVYIGE